MICVCVHVCLDCSIIKSLAFLLSTCVRSWHSRSEILREAFDRHLGTWLVPYLDRQHIPTEKSGLLYLDWETTWFIRDICFLPGIWNFSPCSAEWPAPRKNLGTGSLEGFSSQKHHNHIVACVAEVYWSILLLGKSVLCVTSRGREQAEGSQRRRSLGSTCVFSPYHPSASPTTWLQENLLWAWQYTKSPESLQWVSKHGGNLGDSQHSLFYFLITF